MPPRSSSPICERSLDLTLIGIGRRDIPQCSSKHFHMEAFYRTFSGGQRRRPRRILAYCGRNMVLTMGSTLDHSFSERPFCEFNGTIDQRNTFARLVIGFAWGALSHQDLGDCAKPHPFPVGWNAEPSFIRSNPRKGFLLHELSALSASIFFRANAPK